MSKILLLALKTDEQAYRAKFPGLFDGFEVFSVHNWPKLGTEIERAFIAHDVVTHPLAGVRGTAVTRALEHIDASMRRGGDSADPSYIILPPLRVG